MQISTENHSKSPRSRRRAALLTTASIASFALTLLAAGIAVLTGLAPLHLGGSDRLAIGELLFVMPIVALVLGVVVEATGVALTRRKLPEPRRRQTVRWMPTRR